MNAKQDAGAGGREEVGGPVGAQGDVGGQGDADVDALEQARRWLAEQGVEPTDEPTAARSLLTSRSRPGEPHSTGPRTVEADPSAGGASARGAVAPPAWSGTAGDEPDADPVAAARTIVLRKLAAQARTRAELRKALDAKQVPVEASEAVLDRMEAVGLVDDAGFAQDWVTSRQQRRHLSRMALRRELVAKGVEGDHIEAALEHVDDDDELAAARRLAAKKMPSLAGQDRQVQYRRLAGVLGRRGFSSSLISRVVSESINATDQ